MNNLSSAERNLVLALGSLLAANSLASQVSGIVGIAGVLETSGPNGYLIALGIVYTLIIGVAAGQSLIIDRLPRFQLAGITIFAFGIIFLLLRMGFLIPQLDTVMYSGVYIMSEFQWVLLPMTIRLFSNDILLPADLKRLFPLVLAVGTVGKFIGLGVTFFTPRFLESINVPIYETLLINVLVYLIAFAILQTLRRYSDERKFRRNAEKSQSIQEILSAGYEFVQNVPSFRYLAAGVLLLTMADTLVEYHFVFVTDIAFPDPVQYTSFFSVYRVATTIVAFALQAGITATIMRRFQERTYYLLPVILIIFTSLMLIPGISVIATIIGLGIIKIVRDGPQEAQKTLTLGQVAESKRGAVTTFIDSYIIAGATVIGVLFTGLLIVVSNIANLLTSYLVLGFTIALGIAGMWSVHRLIQVYTSSMWRTPSRKRSSFTSPSSSRRESTRRVAKALDDLSFEEEDDDEEEDEKRLTDRFKSQTSIPEETKEAKTDSEGTTRPSRRRRQASAFDALIDDKDEE